MKTENLKILVVDDEEDILEIIRYNLEHAGYLIETARDGSEALEKARSFLPDLIILDIMMPRKTGIEAMKEFQKYPLFAHTRFIFLTALGGERPEIEGLNLGADDYIVKPIKPGLLVSRINALLRRMDSKQTKVIRVGDLTMDRERFLVTYQGTNITLARKEYELLELLASKPGRVFLRPEILSRVWGTEIIVGDRTIDVHIRKIRQKIDNNLISTVKGIGYKLEV